MILTRQITSDQGTFGVLIDDNGTQIAVTCERPDNGNQVDGCIPCGSYMVTPFNSPSKGQDFLVQDVPNRTMIEIHTGNTIKDTSGCILVGMQFGHINQIPAVLNSRITLNALLERYPDGFLLTIKQDYT